MAAYALAASVTCAVYEYYGAAFFLVGALGVILSVCLRRKDGSWTPGAIFVASSGFFFGFANCVLLASSIGDLGVFSLLDHEMLPAAFTLSAISVAVCGAVLLLLPASVQASGTVFERMSRTSGIARLAFALLAVTWLSRLGLFPIRSIGFLSVFFLDGATLAIFLLRMGSLLKTSPPPIRRRLNRMAATVLVVEVPYQLANSVLRSDTIWVLVAWSVPALLAGRRPKRRTIASLAGVAVVALLLFQPLGESRDSVRGSSRLPFLVDSLAAARPSRLGEGALAVTQRLSTVAQLTLIGKLSAAGEKGPAIDVTIFVPRFIYPTKATVSPGEWFAEALGRGQPVEGGFSNAINLTPAGHFYIAYGWIAVVAGLALQSYFFWLSWKLSIGRRGTLTAFDLAIGFLTIKQAVFLASSGAVLVSQVSLLAVALAVRQLMLVMRGELQLATLATERVR